MHPICVYITLKISKYTVIAQLINLYKDYLTFFMLAWTNNFPQRTIVTVCRPSNISPVVKSIVILRLINLLMWRRPLILTIQVSLYFSLNGVNKFPVHEGWLYYGGGDKKGKLIEILIFLMGLLYC